jgi:hypothetical protein
MLYDELHRRFGNHIARRVLAELTRTEFLRAKAHALAEYLDLRAEVAHRVYQTYMDNPFGREKSDKDRKKQIDILYRLWHEAEDLAFVIAVAEGVGHNTVLVAVAGR